MNNVFPIRPGVQIPNAFSINRPVVVGAVPMRVAPAGQTAQPSMSLWKFAAIAVGAVVVYEGAAYVWHQQTSGYRR